MQPLPRHHRPARPRRGHHLPAPGPRPLRPIPRRRLAVVILIFILIFGVTIALSLGDQDLLIALIDALTAGIAGVEIVRRAVGLELPAR